MIGKKGFRAKIADKMNLKIADKVEQLVNHIEDISEKLDEMTKAQISIYRDVKVMSSKLNIELAEPLVNMNLEKGTFIASKNKAVDAEVVETKSIKEELTTPSMTPDDIDEAKKLEKLEDDKK